jgi:pseudouridine-5'-phosphate glycosidase
MRTSMNIPKDLLDEAVRQSGAATQTMAVVMGLEELIRKKKLERLAALRESGVLRLSRRDVDRSRRR